MKIDYYTAAHQMTLGELAQAHAVIDLRFALEEQKLKENGK